MDRRAKLLGLDARRAVDVITPEALENVITQMEAEIAEMEHDPAGQASLAFAPSQTPV